MEPPDTLQHEVHGRGVCEHEVEVDVEALLDHLGCDDDVSEGALLTFFPETFEHPAITGGTFGGQETRVQQSRLLTAKNGSHG
ncbi:MAG: hypothetical protein E6044_09650, partial [Actinomyces sp.]|nr:hypothetical protein [Actinomyces sp.]